MTYTYSDSNLNPNNPIPPTPRSSFADRVRAWSPVRKGVVGLVIVLLAICVLCSCGLGVLSALQGGTHTTAGVHATATAKPKPTAKPTPTQTPDPNAGASAYATLVSADSSELASDLSTTGSDCSNSSIDTCKQDLEVVSAVITGFLADLNRHPTPPCLATVDRELRAALQDLQTGANDGIQGINDNDSNEITLGANTISQATSELTTATKDLGDAHCS